MHQHFLAHPSRLVFLALTTAILFSGCSSEEKPPTTSITSETTPADAPTAAAAPTDDEPIQLIPQSSTAISPTHTLADPFPMVLIKTNKGNIKVKLNGEKAPRTVENFMENYVKRGFYTDTIFHYVAKDFMITGGGYTATQEYKEPMTPIRNEAQNGLLNKRGTIAMMRHPDYIDSASSQFFINLVDNPSLDYVASEDEATNTTGYCVFGEVVEGMEIADAIGGVAVSDDNANLPSTPVEAVVVTGIEPVK